MASKTINTRVKNKHGTEAYWTSHSSFVPLAGEIIIYDPDSTNTCSRIKTGNGTTSIGQLQFCTLDIQAISSSEIDDICV